MEEKKYRDLDYWETWFGSKKDHKRQAELVKLITRLLHAMNFKELSPNKCILEFPDKGGALISLKDNGWSTLEQKQALLHCLEASGLKATMDRGCISLPYNKTSLEAEINRLEESNSVCCVM